MNRQLKGSCRCRACGIETPRVECPQTCQILRRHRHHKCKICGRQNTIHEERVKRNPDYTDRIYLFELLEPKMGSELKRALRLRWGTRRPKRWRRGLWDYDRVLFISRWRLQLWKMHKRLQWLIENGYLEHKDRYIPRQQLWREIIYKKRYYTLTPMGREYTEKFAEEYEW